ncbi:MAG: hypothetical protein SFU83_14975 [Meiothermus sp.]|nr:hypothetical protein [Meiothermus sp.]
MATYTIKKGEEYHALVVPLELNNADPSPGVSISAVEGRLVHTVTGEVVTLVMQVDTSPTGTDEIYKDFTSADWASIPVGTYRATWKLTIGGQISYAPSEGYDEVIIQAP